MSEEFESSEKSRRRRGIYLLPNLFTTGALFCGFYAIVAAINGHFESAAIAIFVSMVLDNLDGRVARLTNTQSAFGAEYDSLSDLVSFGLAPALLIYTWSLSSLGKLGWLAAFIYTATAALRLARFNTQVGKVNKAYFQGLASPAAAARMKSIGLRLFFSGPSCPEIFSHTASGGSTEKDPSCSFKLPFPMLNLLFISRSLTRKSF